MLHSPGFVKHGEQGLICKLEKAIYGLNQSPWAWFDKFSNALLKYGFSISQIDHSGFIYPASSIVMLLVVCVDDIMLAGNNAPSINTLKDYLR